MKPEEKTVERKAVPALAFLRWIGGKRLLVSRLKPFLPSLGFTARYHEPFIGAASMFFAVRPRSARLADLNRHLIDCYRYVRDSHESVAKYLSEHAAKNSEAYYKKVREIYNRSESSAAQAARFIFLNCTCFNGVFRVNKQGEFNVPYGDKPEPRFPARSELASVSAALKKASLIVADFEKSLDKVKAGDFVYLDPPYPPLNGTSFFTHYTADRFDSKNQARLASAVREIDKKGALFMMTNADLPSIRTLYKGFQFIELSVTRYVSCKGTRYRVSELVIVNYDAQVVSVR